MKQSSVCLVGVGAIGGVHLDAYLNMVSVQLTVVETNPAVAQELQERGIRVLPRLEDSWSNFIDIYDVCLPTFLHKNAILSILDNTNAAILCEKPIAIDLDETEKILTALKPRQRLFCAFVERFNEPCILLKNFSDQSTKPLEMSFTRRTKKPLNASWFNHTELGGDILLDLGIHDIDLACWYSGSTIASISDHVYGDNEHESFVIHFENDSTAKIDLGWDLPDNHRPGIENIMEVRSGGKVARYISDKEMVLINQVEFLVRPRFPLAYNKEIVDALALVNQETLINNFPSLDTLKQGMQTYELIKKDRK
jgi:predicted dehydrogenase